MPVVALRQAQGHAAEVLRVALRLGLTSFGGPIAHLGYFERVYVRERGWLSAEQYAALVALCQILPGPTSSQVGFLIGLHRAGWRGALLAWVGFTLPSAVLLYAGARLAMQAQGPLAGATLHGLKLVAVAVVAQAVWSMARRLCTDLSTAVIAVCAAALLLAASGSAVQLAALTAGFAAGLLWCRPASVPPLPTESTAQQRAAWLAFAAYTVLLLGLPLLAWRYPHSGLALAQVFYRAGALVFGGGHVVLPLLRAALVPTGWLSDDAFLAGYGLAQAVPGPLFTVAAYLGPSALPGAPASGALIALIATSCPDCCWRWPGRRCGWRSRNAPACVRGSPGSTRRSSGSWRRRSTTRSGPAPCAIRQTSPSQPERCCCSRANVCRRSWWCYCASPPASCARCADTRSWRVICVDDRRGGKMPELCSRCVLRAFAPAAGSAARGTRP